MIGNSFGQPPLDIRGTGPFFGPPALNGGAGGGVGFGEGGVLAGEGTDGCEVGVVLLAADCKLTGVSSLGLPGGYV